jgi:phosphoribosyl-ATP pyrophosphohydrolase
MKNESEILEVLYQVILDRKANPSDNSYTSSLMQKGIDKILKKIGEEATEVVIAAKGGVREEIVYESADLIFHLLVLLGHQDIPPEAVWSELQRRFGSSGIAEKAARCTSPIA